MTPPGIDEFPQHVMGAGARQPRIQHATEGRGAQGLAHQPAEEEQRRRAAAIGMRDAALNGEGEDDAGQAHARADRNGDEIEPDQARSTRDDQ